METYKYGDIKISVSCEMERDEEMEAAIEYMMAAKERLKATKQTLNPRIEAVGEARLVAILKQLHGLVETMRQAGIDSTLVASCGAFENVRLGRTGQFVWYPATGAYESCNINDSLEALKTTSVFRLGVKSDGIITCWDEKRVYDKLRKALLYKIQMRTQDAHDQASRIEEEYRIVAGGAK